MRVLLLAGVIVLTACERRTVPPDQRAADSTAAAAVMDSVRIDSLRVDSLRADSLRRDSLRVDSTRAAAARAKSGPRIIGHDSAFGPLFAVDSLGRRVELPVRRP